MRTRVLFLVSALLLCAAMVGDAFAQPLAFPGADGMGRFAKGGRGGVVFQVTNLQDSGPGSLRACVEAAGPRTCVFRVAGDIFLQSEFIVGDPFLTVPGQTAPGQGVQLRHGNNTRNGFRVDEPDVIVRHIKIRLGPTVTDSDIPNCFQIGPVNGSFPTNVIFDHISCSFTTDQSFAINSPSDFITVSNSLFAYSLHDSTHTQGKHSKGPNFRGCGISMIGSLISNHVIRNPNNTCGFDNGNTLRNGAGPSGEVEFRNNVVFNGQDAFYDYFNGRGESWSNLVGNLFIRGPNTKNKLQSNIPHGIYAVDAWDQASRFVPSGGTDPQHLCLQDNVGINLPTNTTGGAAIFGVLNPNDAHLVESTDCVNNPVGRPGDIRGITGAPVASSAVEAQIASGAGAFWWNRDTLDTLILQRLALRQGSIINHPADLGGWPVMASGTPYPDADADGMDDTWEASFGLDPANAADRNGDQDGDGFTNLEEFLAHAARDQVGMGSGGAAMPVISISGPASVNEGTAASACAAPANGVTFTLTRTGDLSAASSVLISSGEGMAPAASTLDMCPAFLGNIPISFAPGESVKTRVFNVRRDGVAEGNENFAATISDAASATIGTATVNVTIIDDDGATASAFSVGAAVETAGSASVHPSPNAKRLGVQRDASPGVIVAGPKTLSGQAWWQVDYASGPDGWSRQISLKVQ